MRNGLILKAFTRPYCSSCFRAILESRKSKLPKPAFNVENFGGQLENLKSEMRLRKQNVALEKLFQLPADASSDQVTRFAQSAAFSLPNRVHPTVMDIAEDFRVVKEVGQKREYPFAPMTGTALLMDKDLLLMDGLGIVCGDRSYYFIGDAVTLEQALIDYTVDKLLAKNFSFLSVPDILIEDTIERCGMPTSGERTQVYKLDPNIYGDGWCLSGTSEMAIAQYLMNRNFEKEELPKLYSAVSRCYRAEVSATAAEKGIYRVHQFTKVEMFGVCLPDQSDSLLESFVAIQEELFGSHGLHYRVLDMSAHELGNQAYRKFDVEAWMPGSDRFGEVSSASNCTDYQTRRLNIRSGDTFLHTVNGTACAIPRAVNAICETFQIQKGRVVIPEVLQPYTGFEVLGMKRGPSFNKLKGNVDIVKEV